MQKYPMLSSPFVAFRLSGEKFYKGVHSSRHALMTKMSRS